MNKKAYTIIELLAVIAIIGLIFTIGIVSYSTLIEHANNRVYESYVDSMHEAAMMYFTDKLFLNNSVKKIMLSDLLSANRIEPINNPKKSTDKCDKKSLIFAERKDTNGAISITYNVCLICDDDNYSNATDEKICGWEVSSESEVTSGSCLGTSRISNPTEGSTYKSCRGGNAYVLTAKCPNGTTKTLKGNLEPLGSTNIILSSCEGIRESVGLQLCHATPISSTCSIYHEPIFEMTNEYVCVPKCKEIIN